MANLFESVQLGSLVLANRVFMAPLTRSRAAADGVSFPESVTDRMPLGAYAQLDIDTLEEVFDVALGNSEAPPGPRFRIAFAAPIEDFDFHAS